MNEMIHIRDEAQADAPHIQNIHERAFGGQYESRLVDMLREAGHIVLSIVASVGDEIVGNVILSPATIEPRVQHSRWLGLGPIGVLPEHQGRGIGSLLVKTGLERCQSMGYDGVILLGSPAYYSRFGFVRASKQGLTSEYGDGPAFQVIELREDALAEAEGKMVYSPEFKDAETER